MSKLKGPIRIGGVPEHFNLPWHLAMEKGRFREKGLEVDWKDFPGGTGAMTRELRHGQLDVAVILTEGAIASIANGNQSAIMQFYVSTPLTWGVFVDADSPIQAMEDAKEKRFAVSRIGSGSHLMARVFAREHGFVLDPTDPFKVVGNLDGAVLGMEQEKELLFLWEEFTTKYLVDNGTFRMLNKFETPWPCFVIAVRKRLLKEQPEEVKALLEVINKEAAQFMADPAATKALVGERYGLSKEDTNTWYARTAWETQGGIALPTINKVVEHLKSLHLIDIDTQVEELCAQVPT